MVGEAGVFDDAFERIGVDAFVAGDGDVVEAVGHADVLTLMDNPEASFGKSSNHAFGT